MARPLGARQYSVLKSMADSRSGQWFAGCGWIWDTNTGTQKILESLERRGLVERIEDEDEPMPSFGSHGWYQITQAGRNVFK